MRNRLSRLGSFLERRLSFSSASSNWSDAALAFFFPFRCLDCTEKAEQMLCPTCIAKLPFIDLPVCQRCGVALDSESEFEDPEYFCQPCQHSLDEGNGDHRVDGPLLEACYSLLFYNPVVSKLLKYWKFPGSKRYTRQVAWLLDYYCEHFLQQWDWQDFLLVPVPLHKVRLQIRGFNQAHELAVLLQRRFCGTITAGRLQRLRDTAQQSLIVDRQERKQNVAGAFAVSGNFSGQRIVLIDDVITTGATVTECARVLKGRGAAQIVVFALARGRRYKLT